MGVLPVAELWTRIPRFRILRRASGSRKGGMSSVAVLFAPLHLVTTFPLLRRGPLRRGSPSLRPFTTAAPQFTGGLVAGGSAITAAVLAAGVIAGVSAATATLLSGLSAS